MLFLLLSHEHFTLQIITIPLEKQNKSKYAKFALSVFQASCTVSRVALQVVMTQINLNLCALFKSLKAVFYTSDDSDLWKSLPTLPPAADSSACQSALQNVSTATRQVFEIWIRCFVSELHHRPCSQSPLKAASSISPGGL